MLPINLPPINKSFISRPAEAGDLSDGEIGLEEVESEFLDYGFVAGVADGSIWKTKKRLKSAPTLYVSSASGSDNEVADGSEANPFATINYATQWANYFYDFCGQTLNIQLDVGTHLGLALNHYPTIVNVVGDVDDYTTTLIDIPGSSYGVYILNSHIYLNGVLLGETALSTGILAQQNSIVELNFVGFSLNRGGAHIVSASNSFVYAEGAVDFNDNANTALLSRYQSRIVLNATTTISGRYANFVNAQYNSFIDVGSTPMVGEPTGYAGKVEFLSCLINSASIPDSFQPLIVDQASYGVVS